MTEQAGSGSGTSDSSPARLRVADCDLEGITEALDDHSWTLSWYFDPATGEVEPESDDISPDEREERAYEHDNRRLLAIASEGSRDAYRDMERFANSVSDPAISGRLQRSLEGRGAFRRFRDELYRLPEIYGKKWHEYADLRAEERAIDWLRYHSVVAEDDAEREAEERERQAVAVLDEIEALGGLRIDVDDVPARWSEILASLTGGNPVTLLADAEVFAVIEPER